MTKILSAAVCYCLRVGWRQRYEQGEGGKFKTCIPPIDLNVHFSCNISRQEFNDKSWLFQSDTNDQLPVDENGPGDFNLFETEGGDNDTKEPDKVCIVIAFPWLCMSADILLYQISYLKFSDQHQGRIGRARGWEWKGWKQWAWRGCGEACQGLQLGPNCSCGLFSNRLINPIWILTHICCEESRLLINLKILAKNYT